MSDDAVKVDHVSMCFNLEREKTSGLKDKVIQTLKGKHRIDEFYALSDISFTIPKGDSFALVGANGSGKSTMLKVIAGIYKPTKGSVQVNGTIAPLIELGAGFDAELTARENVFLNGAVLGIPRKMMAEYFDSILDFAELWDFVDVPIKNYSSGMYARLGFSIATIVKPEILIVDEILAVGDSSFQDKCEKKMDELLSGGTTLILVSHDADQVVKMCRRALWLEHGHAMAIGDAQQVCREYMGK